MVASIEIVGVYLVRGAEQPASLIELWIRGFNGVVDFGQFIQDVPDLGASREQVAYQEHSLSEDGASGEELALEPLVVKGDARVAFFLHFLDHARPIQTPFGPISLPAPSEWPARLEFVKYWAPD